MNNVNAIPDYSKIESFNLAAIEAIRGSNYEKDIKDGKVSIIYKYKGRTLKVIAKVVVWGNMDGELILDSVNVLSVESFKGESVVLH